MAARRRTRPSIAAIQDLKARGFGVTLTPFIFMDVPADNAAPDPYTGSHRASRPTPGAAASPSSPAPGEPGTPDKTGAAATQVAAFVGTAEVADFAVDGESVAYSGPDEWSFRRFILHYAHLAAAAGGVDAFVIGTEMRGLTTVRDSASTYPFVAALADLAADVKSVLGPGHQGHLRRRLVGVLRPPARRTASGDVYFHLDPLWAIRRHRRHRHRRLLAARRLARRPRPRRPPRRRRLDLRPRLSHRQPRRRRGLRLVLRQLRRPRRAGPHAHHRRRRRQALGVPLQGHPQLVAQPALRPPRRHRVRHAHRLGAAVQAVLVHGARLPRRRQGRQPAQRLRRSQKLRIAPALLLPRQARRLHAAPLPAGVPRGPRSRHTTTTSPAPTPCPPSTAAAWSISTACTSTPGTRGPIRPSPPTRTPGATAPTGVSATGSPAASPAHRWPPPCAPFSPTTASRPTTPARSTARSAACSSTA